MEPNNITIEILKDIRDGIRTTNLRLDQTRTELSERLDQTNERIDRLERRQVESETRIATELIAVAGAVNGLREDLREERALRQRVDDHERRIQAIERRAGSPSRRRW